MSTIIEEYINKENIREGEREASPPKTQNFSFKRVKMEQERMDSLLKDFGKEKIDEMLERLDEYADINPKRFNQYACHATVIRKWIREDKLKKASVGGYVPKHSTFTPDSDEKLAKAVAVKVKGTKFERDITVGVSYIEFTQLRDSYYSFGTFGFRDKVLNALRKMNLPIDGL